MIADGALLDRALHGEQSDPRAYLARFGYAAPPLDRVDDGPSIEAEVNHGTWIWRCPCNIGSADDPPVGGGIVFVDQLVGWCVRCENAAVVGRWRRLFVPDERDAIEAALRVRPDVETRNWRPGETVEALLCENAEHDIGGRAG